MVARQPRGWDGDGMVYAFDGMDVVGWGIGGVGGKVVRKMMLP